MRFRSGFVTPFAAIAIRSTLANNDKRRPGESRVAAVLRFTA
jgi:hypothetical protein